MPESKTMKQRKRFVFRIKILGITMFLCNRCRPSNLVCKVFRDSGRCGNYVRREYTNYDAKLINKNTFNRVDRERAHFNEA